LDGQFQRGFESLAESVSAGFVEFNRFRRLGKGRVANVKAVGHEWVLPERRRFASAQGSVFSGAAWCSASFFLAYSSSEATTGSLSERDCQSANASASRSSSRSL